MESVEELLMVRGITMELFYGVSGRPGLSRFVTVYGVGKININTAPSLVLKSLSDQTDQGMVEDMLSYRGDEDNDLKETGWYKEVPGMGDVEIAKDLLTTSSSFFEIVSKGRKGSLCRLVMGMVERGEGTMKILTWRAE
jgi:general secretion pathway protein K